MLECANCVQPFDHVSRRPPWRSRARRPVRARRSRRPRPRTPPDFRRRCCRGCRASKLAAISSRAIIAPIGSPPPSALASVTISGLMPVCSNPKNFPVRPMPVCTSSRINSSLWRSHQVAQPLQVVCARHDHAALALDRLDHHADGLRRAARDRAPPDRRTAPF